VLYNNRFADARGWIRSSAAFAVKTQTGKSLVQKGVGEGLGLPNDPGAYAVFREHFSGLQYIRNCRELWERGIYAELGAYKCQVYVDFSVVFDDAQGRWSGLAAELSGRGVPRIDDALRERELRPVRNPFAALLGLDAGSVDSDSMLRKFEQFLRPAAQRAQGRVDESASIADFKARLSRLTELTRLSGHGAGREEPVAPEQAPPIAPPGIVAPGGAAAVVMPPGGAASTQPAPVKPAPARAFLWPWTILRPLCGPDPLSSPALSWIHEWMLAPMISDYLLRAGWDEQSAGAFSSLFEVALHTEALAAKPRAETDASRQPGSRRAAARKGPARKVKQKAQEPLPWKALLGIPAAESFLRVHLFEGVRWFSKEALELLLPCIELAHRTDSEQRVDLSALLESAAKSGYRWDDFLTLIDPGRA
jgi:hypothetical protein